MSTTTLSVQGMTCQNCVRHVREALTNLPGVQNADVSLEENRAVVTHEDTVDPQKMVEVVEEEGYTARKED